MAAHGVHLEVGEGHSPQAGLFLHFRKGQRSVGAGQLAIEAGWLDAQIAAEAVGTVIRLELPGLQQGHVLHGDALLAVGNDRPEGDVQPLACDIRTLHVLPLLPGGVLGVYRRGGGTTLIVGQHLRHLVAAEDQIILPAFQDTPGPGPVPHKGQRLRHLAGQGLPVEVIVEERVVDLHVLRLPALHHELALHTGVRVGHIGPLRGEDAEQLPVDEDLR